MTAAKTAQKGRKQLQFYDGFGNLMKSEGLEVSIGGIHGKSILIQSPHTHFCFDNRNLALDGENYE
jgi:hypothetical protein